MPRLLPLLALGLALLMVGAPSIIAELAEDDCAEACAGEDREQSCPDEGCADCSLVCASCARTHLVAPTGTARIDPWRTEDRRWLTNDSQRVPAGPPPQGVFHPPRVAG